MPRLQTMATVSPSWVWTLFHWTHQYQAPLVILLTTILSSCPSEATTWGIYEERSVQLFSFPSIISTHASRNTDGLASIKACAFKCSSESLCDGFYLTADETCHLAGGTLTSVPDPVFDQPGVFLYQMTSSGNSCTDHSGFSVVTINGKKFCFRMFSEKVTFPQARDNCAALGANLFQFEGNFGKITGALAAIVSINPTDVHEIWTGLHTFGQLTQWTWDHSNQAITQEDFDAIDWENTPSTGDRCAVAELDDGDMDDDDCDTTNYYMCEIFGQNL